MGGHGCGANPNSFKHTEPVEIRHLDIEKQDIGFVLNDRPHSLRAVPRLTGCMRPPVRRRWPYCSFLDLRDVVMNIV